MSSNYIQGLKPGSTNPTLSGAGVEDSMHNLNLSVGQANHMISTCDFGTVAGQMEVPASVFLPHGEVEVTMPKPEQQPQHQNISVGFQTQAGPQSQVHTQSLLGFDAQPQVAPQSRVYYPSAPDAPVIARGQGGDSNNMVNVAEYTELGQRFPGGLTYRGGGGNGPSVAGYFIRHPISPQDLHWLEQTGLTVQGVYGEDQLPTNNMLNFYAHPEAVNTWHAAENIYYPRAAPVPRRAARTQK